MSRTSRTPRRLRGAALALAAGLVALLGAARAGGVAELFRHDLAPHKATHPTKIRLLTENDEAWYARWYVLDSATETLDVHYFVLKDDLFGKALLGLLRKKARQGVKVRLMIDDRGSMGLAYRWLRRAYVQELATHPNVEVRVYRPLLDVIRSLPRDLRHFAESNHDKIVLADGEWAIVGGRNLRAAYYTHPEDDPAAYRDNDVLLQGGTLGAEVRAAFEEEFALSENLVVPPGRFDDLRGEGVELELARRVMQRWMQGRGLHEPQGPYRRLLRRLNGEVSRHQGLRGYTHFARDPWQGRRAYPTKILDKHSMSGTRNDITPALLQLIDAAQERITIQSAYLVLTEEARAALERAGERGVAITIHTNSPASTDSFFTQAFFLREWWQYLRDIPNLRLLMFTGKRKIHAKTLVFDDTVTVIGSYNLDPMSQDINSEVVAFSLSPELSRRMRLRIEEDYGDSTECKIKIHPDGTLEKLVGPENFLRGVPGLVMRLLSKVGFLRPIV